jgi:hypothetical protein
LPSKKGFAPFEGLLKTPSLDPFRTSHPNNASQAGTPEGVPIRSLWKQIGRHNLSGVLIIAKMIPLREFFP